ncbi:MAG: hypothetical protein JWQ09_4473 [Segetibacter sp.]|nr:hypothetical protein [Segetibacter sp.]
MTTAVMVLNEKKSDPLFIGLKAYTEEQSHIFFGRDEEIKTLYKLIKANTITIVFGKSGTGKTSLLNAGVFPKLREIYCLPFRIRLEFFDNSPDLITQIKQVLKTEIDKYEFHVESYPATETLWEYFHKEPLWKIITPVLIFDQFEEIFTLANKSSRFKKQELDTLIEELSDLIENSIPDKLQNELINGNEDLDFEYDKQKAKILFSFREDFLAEIESITVKIPSVKNSRFRLHPMHGQQAYEVITKTWKKAIDPSEANKIVYFLTNETETESIDVEKKYGKYDIIDVEPSLLSQVCSFIEKERIEEGSDKISAEFLKKHPKDQILRALYNQSLSESNEVIKLKDQRDGNGKSINALKEFIEDNLITDEGYRTKFALKKIDEKIRPGIELLKEKYLLREEGENIELTHDVIVTLVKSDREERRKKLALAREKKKAKKKMRLIVILVFLAVAATGAVAYTRITAKANKDKKEAFAQRDKAKAESRIIISKNDSLRKDSLNLEKAIAKKKSSLADSTQNGNAIKEKILVDSITFLIKSINSLNDDYINNSTIYKDSINTLVKTVIKYKQIEADLKASLENIRNENSQPKPPSNDRITLLENKEKGYISKITGLEQRIGLLQKSRDSLAAIIANNIVKQPYLYPDLYDPEGKKKIFGYGYDYHNLKRRKKK